MIEKNDSNKDKRQKEKYTVVREWKNKMNDLEYSEKMTLEKHILTKYY